VCKEQAAKKFKQFAQGCREAVAINKTSASRSVIKAALSVIAEGLDMFDMIYTSREKQEFSAPDLKRLLMSARIRNNEVGVTGILVYYAGTFLQVLEGGEAEVRTIFSRIKKDVRHGDVRIINCNVSIGRRRMFGEWSMGFADTAGAARVFKGFIDLKGGPSLTALDETQAIDILKRCSQEPLQFSA
jgi:hypothetical protein